MHPTHTLEDLISGTCTVAQALQEGPHGLRILAGRSGSTLLAQADEQRLTQVIETIRRASTGFDVAICDTGAGIGPSVLAATAHADLVLAVTTPDPASVTDTYALCKVLTLRQCPLPGLVVNRSRNRDSAMSTTAKLSTVCEKFLRARPVLLGWLGDDRGVERSVLEQRPYAIHGTGEPLEDLRSLSAAVLSALPGLSKPTRAPASRKIVPLRKSR
jgi:flagellar biosynthesis protein FlhG